MFRHSAAAPPPLPQPLYARHSAPMHKRRWIKIIPLSSPPFPLLLLSPFFLVSRESLMCDSSGGKKRTFAAYHHRRRRRSTYTFWVQGSLALFSAPEVVGYTNVGVFCTLPPEKTSPLGRVWVGRRRRSPKRHHLCKEEGGKTHPRRLPADRWKKGK